MEGVDRTAGLRDRDDADEAEMQAAGESADDFTIRGLLAGLLIGCLLAFTNLYLGLQSGWISIMSLQSSLLGYALFKLIPRKVTIQGRTWTILSKPFTPAENVLVQTTAAAVGIMPLSAGLVGVIPALNKLSVDKDGTGPIQLDFVHLVAWCLAIAYFGVFFASPLREPMIVKEKLTFPSGTATAQLISVLHGKPLYADRIRPKAREVSASDTENRARELETDDEEDEQARLLTGNSHVDTEAAQAAQQGWKPLSYSFAGSSIFTVLSYYIPVLYAIPIFDVLPPHNLSSMWGFWFTPSLNYIGQGIIMGLPTTLSMTAGALVGWGILSPMAHYYEWAPGHPLDSETGGRGWILWISLAVMCSESVVGLFALIATNGVRDFKSYTAARHVDTDADANTIDVDEDHEPAHRQTPKSWVISGLVLSTLLAVLLVYWAFGADAIAPWATVVGIVLASVFAILGVRALGETDLNPVSGIGKISQLVFALLQPGNVVANLIAGGISEAGAMQAGDLMQDYKTGHLVGASPRAQFKGQLVGSTLGILISSFAYKLYTATYEIPGPQFPAPTAAVWLNLARLVNHGHLPAHVQLFMIIFGAIFALSGAMKTLARSKALHQGTLNQSTTSRADKIARLVPSGIAFAVGMLNTPNFSLARLLGGLIAHFYAVRRSKQQSNTGRIKTGSALAGIGIIIIASGFVLGEGAASIITLLLKQNGAQVWTCFGCRGGCAGTCAS